MIVITPTWRLDNSIFLHAQGMLLAVYSISWILCPKCQAEYQAYPRFPTLFPIIHPFTNIIALYGWPNGSVKVNDIGTSKPLGMFNLNVVTKNPTPALEFGRPWTSSRDVQLDVSKPGKCHPFRSPKRPPSLKMPVFHEKYIWLRIRLDTIHTTSFIRKTDKHEDISFVLVISSQGLTWYSLRFYPAPSIRWNCQYSAWTHGHHGVLSMNPDQLPAEIRVHRI